MEFQQGELVRVSVEFRNLAGELIDPSVVSFEFQQPGAAKTTYVHGVNSQLVRDSTGRFRVDVSATTSGYVPWRWFATGTGQSAVSGMFLVKAATL